MTLFSRSVVFLAACIAFCGSHSADGAVTPSVKHEGNQAGTAIWDSSNAQHIYGLPDTKPNARGTLSLNAEGLSFAAKSAYFPIQWHSMIALSAGNERVELWGAKGRLLRLLIPFSGGLAVAAFTHHRVDDLTVEYRDSKGSYHAAVFLLPLGEARRALESSAQIADVPNNSQGFSCKGEPVQPGSVLVRLSTRPHLIVPAVYRALVYEHLIDRLRRVHGVRLVYRQGRATTQGRCPQFNVLVVIAGFRPGNQVLRASTGPIGMFIAPTELRVDVTFSDVSTGESTHQQLKSTVRDDSESRKVAEKAAKTLARHFSSASKEFQNSRPGRSSESTLLNRDGTE